MTIIIVPNAVADEINRKLDAAYVECPEAAVDRDAHYHKLLDVFEDLGFIPDFKLEKNEK